MHCQLYPGHWANLSVYSKMYLPICCLVDGTKSGDAINPAKPNSLVQFSKDIDVGDDLVPRQYAVNAAHGLHFTVS